jgi:hypothetical protein
MCDGLQQGLVSRFGDQELYVSVRDVSGQVLVSAGVVQSDEGRPQEPCTTESEHIIRGVVQKYGDVWRPTRIQTRTVQGGESFGFGEKIGMCPDAVAKPEDRTVGRRRIETVASEEGGDVRSREGNLAERRGEYDRFGHVNRLRAGIWYLADD